MAAERIPMSISLRPATADDLPFARGLYYGTMRTITDRLPDFDMAAHDARFVERFALAEVRIVMRGGRDIGWLQVAESADEIFLKQLFLEPASQRQGIGTGLVRDLIERGRLTGKPVRLGVVKMNPALALYRRLGFAVTSEDDVKFYMEKPSDAPDGQM
jgi:GNAT superfamily N-acetyltransferase